MAKDKPNTQTESPVDNETLLQNMKAFELENTQLKEQLAKAREEKANIETQLNETKEKAESFTNEIHEKDLQIENLTETNKNLENMLNETKNDLNAAQANNNNEELTNQVKDLQEKLAHAEEQTEAANKANQLLTEELNKAKENKEDALTLSPFATAIGNALAEELSAKYGKDIKLSQILEDYLIRYNITEKFNIWFHPFALSKERIIEIAQRIYPKISNFDELVAILKHNAN